MAENSGGLASLAFLGGIAASCAGRSLWPILCVLGAFLVCSFSVGGKAAGAPPEGGGGPPRARGRPRTGRRY